MGDRHLQRLILYTSVFVLAGALALASEPGAFDRTLKVAAPVNLEVRSDPGGVDITAGSSDFVRVRAVIKPLYGRLDLDLAEANIRALVQDPPIEQVGNTIRIGYPKNVALLRAVTIHFEIEVPRMTQARGLYRIGWNPNRRNHGARRSENSVGTN